VESMNRTFTQKFGARSGHAARSLVSIGSSDRTETSPEQGRSGERVTGIEPACPAWEALRDERQRTSRHEYGPRKSKVYAYG